MEVSVVIPTYNRREILRRALLLYNEQREMSGRFEALVVDDGSSDNTLSMLDALGPRLHYPLRHFAAARNAGPAAARNRAIAEASGDILLITGDDILPSETMIHEHWIWHTERYPQTHVGVLGRVKWAEELGPTPFMRWLEECGAQFGYATIRHGEKVDYGHLYTSNISIKRKFLSTTQEYFNEQFRLALFEDSDWALRLFRKGFELRYNAQAIGKHLHPTSLASALARAETAGRCGAALRASSPQNFDRITNGLFTPRNRVKLLLLRTLLHPILGKFVYTPLARMCERRIFASRLFAACHASYFLKGLIESGVA